MLVAPGLLTQMAYHGIAADVNVLRIIQEQRVSSAAIAKRRLRRLGLARVLGQLAFTGFNRFQQVTAKKRIRNIIELGNWNVDPLPVHLVDRVTSINDRVVVEKLQQLRPQAIVVHGTRILSPEILRAVDAPFLNIHMGMTPKYRGVHGGYWALATGDTEHAGVTIHLVDEGIDTGSVLLQAPIHPSPEDSFSTYPVLQMAAAVPLLRRALSEIQSGRLMTIAGTLPSHLWSHPTLLEYLAARWRRGVK